MYETAAQRTQRLEHAASRKFRRISAWNVFQRDTLQGLRVDATRYDAMVVSLGHTWHAMTAEEKIPHQIQAEYENQKREQLQHIPLPVVGQQDVPEASVVGKNACKKISYKRLLHNFSSLDNHPGWAAVLNLQDSRGALKASLINITAPADVIDAKLGHCLCMSQPLFAQDAPEVDAETNNADDAGLMGTCFNRFHMCRSARHLEIVTRLVRKFGRCLEDRSVVAGALLQFSSLAQPEPMLVFLGVVVKKPRIQVVVKAESLDDVAHVPLFNEKPVILTTHQMFQKMLVPCGEVEVPDRINVTVFDYACTADDLPLLQVSVKSQALCEFQVQHTIDRRMHRPKTKLPFGLKMPRQRRATKKKVGAQNASGASSTRRPMPVHDSATSSGSESEGSSSSSSSSGSSGLGEGCDEVVAPASKTVATQEAEARAVNAEVEQADALRAQIAADFKKVGKTYFSKELGIESGAIAVSSASKCFKCNLPILKGTVRFLIWHSRLSPSRWLHASCVVAMAQGSETYHRQFSAKLKEIAGQSSSSSSSANDSKATVLREAIRLSLILQSPLFRADASV
jgi:hypothetical protein